MRVAVESQTTLLRDASETDTDLATELVVVLVAVVAASVVIVVVVFPEPGVIVVFVAEDLQPEMLNATSKIDTRNSVVTKVRLDDVFSALLGRDLRFMRLVYLLLQSQCFPTPIFEFGAQPKTNKFLK